MEGLLNYAYTQTLALNLFDQRARARPHPGERARWERCLRLPGRAGSAGEGLQHDRKTTTDPANFAECAGILGDRQPNINYAANPSGLFGNLRRYDPSVCPDGSTNLAVCDPNAAPNAFAALQGGTTPQAVTPQQQEQQEQQQKQIEKILGDKPGKELTEEAQKKLEEILNLPPPQLPNQVAPSLPSLGGSGSSGSGSSATGNILDFLLGS